MLRIRLRLRKFHRFFTMAIWISWRNSHMERPRMETVIMEEPQASHEQPTEWKAGAPGAPARFADPPTVGAVFEGLLRHPLRNLIHRWNWKSAVLSSLFRAGIFFFTNLVAGWHAAVGALLAELALRAATSGFYGAVTEAFSEARPVWAAMTALMVVLPLVTHSLELLVHWLRGTPKLGLSITASVIFTACSTSFNVYAMRHGVLTVGGKSKSLREDLGRILPLLGQFMLAGPRAIFRYFSIGNSPK
jgi:hypothetical protein